MEEDNVHAYDLAMAKTLLLDTNKTYTTMDDLRLDIYSWILNHGFAMKVKASERIKFIGACPASANMSLEEKLEKRACLFFVSVCLREASGLITFSKKCDPQHSKMCCETMKHTTVEAVMGIVGPLLRMDPKLTPRKVVDTIRDRCGLTVP